MKSNNQFYDAISLFYDEMIDFDKAVIKKTKQLEKFVSSEMVSVADIGCGTGVDSIALSILGLNVTSFDPSKEMLKTANENSIRFNTNILFRNYSADNIPQKYFRKFDLVVSLGNTFANIPLQKLFPSFIRCSKILKKEGRFVFQILNYSKILKEKKRIVKISSDEEKYFIRFYDFLSNKIQFNILSFSKNDPDNSKLISTRIYPHTFKVILDNLLKAGFKKVKMYAGFEGESFHSQESNDLIYDCIN